MLLLGGANPVDAGITADRLVEWINANDLEELVRRVLTHPVAVQYTESLATTTHALLRMHINTVTLFHHER